MVAFLVRRAALWLFATVLLVGCRTEIDVAFDINVDGSGVVEVDFGFDEEALQLASSGGSDFLGGTEAELAAFGWDTEQWERGDLFGVRGSHRFVDPDDLVAVLDQVELIGEGSSGLVFSSLLATPTAADTFVFSADVHSGTLDDFEESYASGEQSRITVRVDLPGRVEDHNADTESGSCLVWEIEPGDGPRSLQARSVGTAGIKSGLILGVGLLAVAAVILLVRFAPKVSTTSVKRAKFLQAPRTGTDSQISKSGGQTVCASCMRQVDAADRFCGWCGVTLGRHGNP
jgi:hypothetical protein